MTSIQPEFKKLPGAYKGTRRRREPPVVAECPCGWKSRPLSPKKAEKRFAAHVAVRHTAPSEIARIDLGQFVGVTKRLFPAIPIFALALLALSIFALPVGAAAYPSAEIRNRGAQTMNPEVGILRNTLFSRPAIDVELSADQETLEGACTRFVVPVEPDGFHMLANGTRLPVRAWREIPAGAALPAGFREIAALGETKMSAVDYWTRERARTEARVALARERKRLTRLERGH